MSQVVFVRVDNNELLPSPFPNVLVAKVSDSRILKHRDVGKYLAARPLTFELEAKAISRFIFDPS
jgi:hypothetical protein